MKADKGKKISDDLIGEDEKVCSCSVRIADLLSAADAKKGEGQPSLKENLAAVKRKREGHV